jgi:signal transduction histidine kinase
MSPEVTADVFASVCSTTILWALALYGAARYRDVKSQRSVLAFVLLMGGCGLWALFHALELFTTTEAEMYLWLRLTAIPSHFVPLAWLVFMLVYIDWDHLVTPRTIGALAVVPTLGAVLSVVFPELMWESVQTETYQDRPVLAERLSALNLVTNMYSYTLTAVGLLIAGRLVITDDARYRGQGLALGLGAAVPLIASLVTVGGFVPHPALDLVPVLFALTGLLFGYAIFRYDLFDLVPVARREAFERLPDVVVVFDEDRRIVEINDSARQLFDVTGDPAGADATDLFSTYPDLVTRLFDSQYVDTEVTLVIQGQLKHFSVTSRAVELRSHHSGTLIILKDITELKEREQDLELLKRIQSRVLRHNIRNDLQVIGGLARTIAADSAGAAGDHAAQIVEQVEQLSETTEKAQQMEAVIDASDDRVDQDVAQVVDRVSEKARERFPQAAIETDTPETTWAMAHGDLEAALWNLTENAIVHNDKAVPEVSITVNTAGASVSVRVTDNGPGIPKHEIDVLRQQSESALQHGSGAGLWLVNWIAEMSAGSLAFDTSGTGTTVYLQLPAADRSLNGTDQPSVDKEPPSSMPPRQ